MTRGAILIALVACFLVLVVFLAVRSWNSEVEKSCPGISVPACAESGDCMFSYESCSYEMVEK